MKNTLGNSVAVTLFGESHGEEIGAVIDGLAAGITVDEEFIAKRLTQRRPAGAISTARAEKDPFRIVSGVFNGKTTGTPICILIPNGDTKSKDYSATRFLPRPGHADYTAYKKYHGFEDYRGGGHFSGRITAALVAAGAIAQKALEAKGIAIGTHIKACAGVKDAEITDIKKDITYLNDTVFAVLEKETEDKMKRAIEAVAKDGDSVGGILESAVVGLPAGVGEPWFDSLESALSHGLFSIPAVKGVEFGEGFEFANMRGSAANDPFTVHEGRVVTKTNHNGGINGGISNGMPLIIRCAVKPTPSIYKEQDTVDMKEGTDAKLQIQGRHDPAIVHRARVVADSVIALVLCDMLALKYGTDFLGE
ncbi:MAG: chorismate synthase [Lachnospiraceae bacterium]|nr:chorismate synthase [Lachnospiraceae bacterium]